MSVTRLSFNYFLICLRCLLHAIRAQIFGWPLIVFSHFRQLSLPPQRLVNIFRNRLNHLPNFGKCWPFLANIFPHFDNLLTLIHFSHVDIILIVSKYTHFVHSSYNIVAFYKTLYFTRGGHFTTHYILSGLIRVSVLLLVCILR